MAQPLVSRSSKALFTRRRTLIKSLELLWTPEVASKGLSSEFHSLAQRSLDCACRTEASSNSLLCTRRSLWRAVGTSAANINDVSAMKFVDAHDFISEKPKVLAGDGQTKRAKVASVPLHVTANASIGNPRN